MLGKKIAKREKYPHSWKQYCYKWTKLLYLITYKKLAVNVESCFCLFTVLFQQRSRVWEQMSLRQKCDYFVCIPSVANAPPLPCLKQVSFSSATCRSQINPHRNASEKKEYLKYVDSICKKKDIKLFTLSGTGTSRHTCPLDLSSQSPSKRSNPAIDLGLDHFHSNKTKNTQFLVDSCNLFF